MLVHIADLVEQARNGDVRAYGTLYEEFQPSVCKFLRARLNGSTETAEDLTSAVFLKVWQKLDLYIDLGLPFESWIYRIARNCLIDHLRRQKSDLHDSLDQAVEVSDPSTSGVYGQVLDRHILEAALAQLGPQQRQVVQLRFIDGLSTIETGVLTGRTSDAVKKLQARGLVNLRRLLSPAKPGVAVAAIMRIIDAAA